VFIGVAGLMYLAAALPHHKIITTRID